MSVLVVEFKLPLKPASAFVFSWGIILAAGYEGSIWFTGCC